MMTKIIQYNKPILILSQDYPKEMYGESGEDLSRRRKEYCGRKTIKKNMNDLDLLMFQILIKEYSGFRKTIQKKCIIQKEMSRMGPEKISLVGLFLRQKTI